MPPRQPGDRASFLSPLHRRLGLRASVALLFASGGFLVSTALSVGTYVIAETYVVKQRDDVAIERALSHAQDVRRAVDTGQNVEVLLGNMNSGSGTMAILVDGRKLVDEDATEEDEAAAQAEPAGATSTSDSPTADNVLVEDEPTAGAPTSPSPTEGDPVTGERTHITHLDLSLDAVPQSLQAQMAPGKAVYVVEDVRLPQVQRATDAVQRAVVTGVQFADEDVKYYEFSVNSDLDNALSRLPLALAAVAAATTLAGALVGWWAARSTLAPLNTVAQAAAEIAGGNLNARVPSTEDPELKTLVRSFNAMADTVSDRIDRERRFAADVSHELRSPVTTLQTALHLINKRRDEMPERAGQAVDLMKSELERFSRSLSDLLELSRLDAGQMHRSDRVVIDELVRETLEATNRENTRVIVPEALQGSDQVTVMGDKSQLHRVFVNLLDNADKYGGGVTSVEITAREGFVVAHVDDSGEGVAPEDRDRIFERFVRSGSRGSAQGTGLGLSLVMEMVMAHGGSAHCSESPYGGARFTVRLVSLASAQGAPGDSGVRPVGQGAAEQPERQPASSAERERL